MVEPSLFRAAVSQVATPVVVVTAVSEERPCGTTVGAFTSQARVRRGHDPQGRLARLCAGGPESNFLIREVPQPVSPVGSPAPRSLT